MSRPTLAQIAAFDPEVASFLTRTAGIPHPVIDGNLARERDISPEALTALQTAITHCIFGEPVTKR